MINTKEYKKELKIGDLIWFHKDQPQDCGEDIGYVRDVYVVKGGLKKYNIIWMKSQDTIPTTEETIQSIKDMDNSYIFPVL